MYECPKCGSKNVVDSLIGDLTTGEQRCKDCAYYGSNEEFEEGTVYHEFMKIKDLDSELDKKMNTFLSIHQVKLDFPRKDIFADFLRWSQSQQISDYKSVWEAFFIYFGKLLKNQIFFTSKRSLNLIRQIEIQLQIDGKKELYVAVRNLVASDGSDGSTLAYPDESIVGENLVHAAIIMNHWNEFESYAHKFGLVNLDRLYNDLRRVTGLSPSDNIVKNACKELGITQKELADKLGVSKPSVERWAQGETPEQAVNQINLLLENTSLKKELEELKNAIKTITKYAN